MNSSDRNKITCEVNQEKAAPLKNDKLQSRYIDS